MGMDAETVNSSDDMNCPIKLSGDSSSTVYLAGPWSGESGRTLSHRVVQFLREKGIRVVGDIIRNPTPPWNPKRVQRIMGGCTGVVAVLPFRSEGDGTRTSPWILQEVDYAIEQSLPLVVFTDDRVSIELQDLERREISDSGVVQLPRRTVLSLVSYSSSDEAEPPSIEGPLTRLADIASRTSARYPTYVFMDLRMQQDFEHPREAITKAVEQVAHVPCIWFDDPRVDTEFFGVREQTRELVKHCAVFIADLSLSPESPAIDSPNRAHEIGYAEAYEKQILVLSQGPRRDPYFAAGDLQIMFWRDEHELYEIVRAWLENKRDLVCRTERREQGNEAEDPFAYDVKRRYRSPSIYPLTTFESTIVAAGFACLAAGAASMAEHLLGYQSGLDLASIVAGLVTLVFASDVGLRVRQVLGRYAFLRWLIPMCGVAALLIAALTRG